VAFHSGCNSHMLTIVPAEYFEEVSGKAEGGNARKLDQRQGPEELSPGSRQGKSLGEARG